MMSKQRFSIAVLIGSEVVLQLGSHAAMKIASIIFVMVVVSDALDTVAHRNDGD